MVVLRPQTEDNAEDRFKKGKYFWKSSAFVLHASGTLCNCSDMCRRPPCRQQFTLIRFP